MSNAAVNLKFRWGLSATDPEQTPVLIVGQVPHLSSLTWDDVRCKLEPRVTEEAWKRGASCACAAPGDACEVWPRAAAVAALPARRSRHAPPSRALALAKLLRSSQRASDECIVLVCRKCDVYACALAVARSYPLYSARSGPTPLAASPHSVFPAPAKAPTPAPRTVCVEIMLVKEEQADGEIEEEGLPELEPYLLDGNLSAEDLQVISTAADSVRLAARIADTPTNFMDVDQFIEEAKAVAKDLEIEAPTIIRGEELRERGFGGLYGVGAAAACPPALAVLSWHPPPTTATTTPAHTVAWVGKGIVYDTGGLSIKSRASMVGMKGDCAGAAAVLAAFAAVVRSKPTVVLHAVLCLAENAVGPKATRPDDIHRLYSGRTVEINNTDAEGRLVLSDGVVYAARDLHADTIVDVATLTGAQGTATGKYHAGVLCNRAALEARCVAAGLRTAEPAHALPFAPELHFPEFASALADMKNSVADRNNAQPSCAGLFILAHLGFDFPGAWLHVDMAAPAHHGERATGYGVGLLSLLFGAHTRSRLLQALSPGPAALAAPAPAPAPPGKKQRLH